MTKTINVHGLNRALREAIDQLRAGEELVVEEDGVPIARLIPCAPPAEISKRRVGLYEGQVQIIDPDWWKPMSDEEVDELMSESSDA